MKLLLHIGTHKTATSSLQLFLSRNYTLMQSHGIYYPIPPSGKKNFNNEAEHLAMGSVHRTVKLFQDIYMKANEKGLQYVVISAESFYAMTNFYGNHLKNETGSYFINEEKRIKDLQKACSIFKEVKIVCYFRPQDDFASSIYNQVIKNDFEKSCSYMDYLNLCPELFNYNSHIKLFEENFGYENVKCINFNDVKKNIIKDFCEQFLSPAIYKLAGIVDYRINERLNRECLEYKRVFNKLVNDRSLHFIVRNGLTEMSSAMPDEKKNHIYASFKDREAYFSKYEVENKKLCNRHSMNIIPVIVNKEGDNSSAHFVKKKYAIFAPSITLYLRKWIKQPNKLTNFYIRKIIYYLIKTFPQLDKFFKVIGKFKKLFKHKLKIE